MIGSRSSVRSPPTDPPTDLPRSAKPGASSATGFSWPSTLVDTMTRVTPLGVGVQGVNDV